MKHSILRANREFSNKWNGERPSKPTKWQRPKTIKEAK
jgi:hypothetical protein